MSGPWRPVDPGALPEVLADALAEVLSHADPGSLAAPGLPVLRVALDGPACADPARLARALVDPLRRRSRPSAVIDASAFWHNASIRYEHGRQDLESYRHWLDAAALQREVLDPLGPGGDRHYLPALRDPQSNRSSRCAPVLAAAGSVVMVAGEFLLDRGLSWDYAIHLSVSPAARRRQTPPVDQWTLPAHDDYDRAAEPAERADLVVKLDDVRHPALHIRAVG